MQSLPVEPAYPVNSDTDLVTDTVSLVSQSDSRHFALLYSRAAAQTEEATRRPGESGNAAAALMAPLVLSLQTT